MSWWRNGVEQARNSDHPAIGAHFSMTIPLADATLATVEQVQEHVIETFYVAVPECPGHSHPLKAALHDGVPSWVFPVDTGHHVEAILPDTLGDPADSTL